MKVLQFSDPRPGILRLHVISELLKVLAIGTLRVGRKTLFVLKVLQKTLNVHTNRLLFDGTARQKLTAVAGHKQILQKHIIQ
jgi:hypothetical protein